MPIRSPTILKRCRSNDESLGDILAEKNDWVDRIMQLIRARDDERQRKTKYCSFNISLSRDEKAMLDAITICRDTSIVDYICSCIKRDYESIMSEKHDGR